MNNTSSGAFVTNDCIIHFANNELPFGGVGQSGYSAYHGKWGFDNLSHMKPVMERSQLLVKLRYPPYSDSSRKILKYLLDNLTISQNNFVKYLAFSVILFTTFIFRNFIYGFVQNKY